MGLIADYSIHKLEYESIEKFRLKLKWLSQKGRKYVRYIAYS